MRIRNKIFIILGIFLCLLCTACQGEQSNKDDKTISSMLNYTHSMELDYAKEFSVDFYEKDYALISIGDSQRFLVIPEGGQIPNDMDMYIVPLYQPLDHIYMAATSVMDMFRAAGAMDQIRLSGTKESNWYIQEAKDAMVAGDILYAGKYNAPDYELILAENCDLSIQSTMILHSPEVKEGLERLGIPVLVDYSSYETHPLGKTEWVKLYGVLTGKEDQAERAFEEQKQAVEQIAQKEATGKTVAFFYLTTNGMANVRRSDDSVPRMIELAGGTYIFSDLKGENAASTVNLQMEEFYATAKDADYLIYNSTIDGEIHSIEELLSKSSLLKDFKAVKNGTVFCATKNMYQESMGFGFMIQDIHKMLTSEELEHEEFSYLRWLE